MYILASLDALVYIYILNIYIVLQLAMQTIINNSGVWRK